MMCSIDTDNTELCLIDCGIDTLQKVPLRPHLQVLNLHSNFIQTLENLSHLRCLKHLDISANQIEEIEGLDGLTSLRTLNLSCNLLKDVRGLAGLRSLVKLNVSYNQIKNISGLKSIQGPDYKLTCVELHGNQISSLQHVVQCLNRCENLRQLILCDNGSSNPVCDITEYRSKILSALPQVEILDNVNRQGEDVTAADVMADIPGLEEYMDYLVSNSTTSLSDEKITEMITPKIDQAIDKFRNRALSSIETSADQYTDNDVNSSVNTAISGQPTAKSQDSRLELLENQLAQLIQASKMGTEKSERGRSAKARVTKHNAKRDVDSTDECSEDSMKQRSKSPGGLKKRKSRLPGYRKSTMSSRSRKDVQTPPPASSGGTTNEDVQSYTSSSQTKQPSVYMKSDFKKREDVQSTYVQIMKELETERERRWKSEQATKKLLDHVNELQSKARDGDQLKDTALEATTKLKQALMNERETKLRLQDDIDKLKEHITEQNRQLKISKDTEESLKRSLKALEEVTAKMEQEKLHQHTHEQKKTQDAQMKAAALNRELELLRATSDKRKGQISQLQELLANREQQHREELKNRYTLDSQELKGVLEENVKKAEKEYNLELKSQRTNIDTLTKQYTELEDEFRMALEIEASRFKELEVAFETVSEENAQNKQALKAAQRKDENSSSVLNELTALVKEQKGRIAELSKSKQEQSLDNKERIQTLEAHVEEARKRMLQMELLKQDKTKLLAQVEAQESVISGLKAERKLWGQELAQQGASLAQDRGRLESKIEAYSAEISTLKKNLEREADALKIKTKMLEDQTETIRKLKEALLERDEEIKRTRDESLKMQRNLEEQLTEERANINDNQETLERLRERKQELKRQVTDIQAELEDSKKAHSILNNKWKEKSQLIGQLEKQVQEMKDNWEGKEKKLTEERNKAIQAANIAIEKLRTIDDAFRNQLDNKEQAHQEEMARLEEEKQIEIDQANQRVAAVEDEMRDLLQENQATKKAMEEKVKKLTRAMSELHSDLF